MEIFIVLLAVSATFLTASVKLKEIRLLIKVAKCFDPSINKYKPAHKCLSTNHKIASRHTSARINNPLVVLRFILEYHPYRVVSIDSVKDMLTPAEIAKFNNSRNNNESINLKNENSQEPSSVTLEKTQNSTKINKENEVFQSPVNEASFSKPTSSFTENFMMYKNMTQESKHEYRDYQQRKYDQFCTDTSAIPSKKIKLPYFKYMETPQLTCEMIVDKKHPCDICNQHKEAYFYDIYDYNVCADCLSTGKIKTKVTHPINFNEQDYLLHNCKPVTNPTFIEEFEFRTPGYISHNDNVWATHCNDFCKYKGIVYWEEIEKLDGGSYKQLINDYKKSNQPFTVKELKANLIEASEMIGHLFKCCHCNHYSLHVEIE